MKRGFVRGRKEDVKLSEIIGRSRKRAREAKQERKEREREMRTRVEIRG